MRTIKFRAWNKSGKNMWDDFYVRAKDGKIGDIETSDIRVVGAERYGYFEEDENMILMQYTGLNDSKGNPIYEGDIVYIAGQGEIEMEFPFIELYEAGAEEDIGEIKGNIYENPNLINK